MAGKENDNYLLDHNLIFLSVGSWTYGSPEVRLQWYQDKQNVELRDYSFSQTWDLIEAPGQIVQNGTKLEFYIRIRRFVFSIL